MDVSALHERWEIPSGASKISAAVDRYLATEIEARALALAFRWGWIDRLIAGPAALEELAGMPGMPARSAGLMRALLAAGEVVEPGAPVALTGHFRAALKFRDLLEAKLWFANTVSPDIHSGLDKLLIDVPAFMAGSSVFELFRYDRCFDVTQENLDLTRRWVSYTTTLTKYEAPVCWENMDLSGVRHLLDVGGNSGEFVRQACARAPHMEATVFDLPVVCALGREHVSGSAEGVRVAFVEGDLRREALPQGHDMIAFKSVLHDWPEEHAENFLRKAVEALPPGGRMLIFERGPIPLDGRMRYAMVPNLVFHPFFREAGFYIRCLQALGLHDIRHEMVELDIPFHLITAEKGR